MRKSDMRNTNSRTSYRRHNSSLRSNSSTSIKKCRTQPRKIQLKCRISLMTDNDGFTLVTRSKKPKIHRKTNVTGMNPSTLLKGVASPPKTRDLFVGRLDPSTLSDAVQSHVNWLLGGRGTSSVEEIQHCAATCGYKGFKVTVPAETVSLVMQAEKWPTHISAKKHYQPKATKSKASPVHTQTLYRSTSAGNITCV